MAVSENYVLIPVNGEGGNDISKTLPINSSIIDNNIKKYLEAVFGNDHDNMTFIQETIIPRIKVDDNQSEILAELDTNCFSDIPDLVDPYVNKVHFEFPFKESYTYKVLQDIMKESEKIVDISVNEFLILGRGLASITGAYIDIDRDKIVDPNVTEQELKPEPGPELEELEQQIEYTPMLLIKENTQLSMPGVALNRYYELNGKKGVYAKYNNEEKQIEMINGMAKYTTIEILGVVCEIPNKWVFIEILVGVTNFVSGAIVNTHINNTTVHGVQENYNNAIFFTDYDDNYDNHTIEFEDRNEAGFNAAQCPVGTVGNCVFFIKFIDSTKIVIDDEEISVGLWDTYGTEYLYLSNLNDFDHRGVEASAYVIVTMGNNKDVKIRIIWKGWKA